MTEPADSRAGLSPTDQALGELIEAYIDRLHAGEHLDAESFVAQHPEHAAELRRLLPAVQVLADLDRSAVPAPQKRPGGDVPPLGELGDYRVLREVGRGGMGVVYEAEQISLGRRVALKVLPFAAALDERHLQRFKNEAQAAAQLHHQNIVPVYAVGSARGVHFYAMQFIDGPTLADLIYERRRLAGLETPAGTPTGPFPPLAVAPPNADAATLSALALGTKSSCRSPVYCHSVAALGIQVAEALEHAHQLGIVHRDVKPSNLLVDGRGNLWITDFGLAQVQSDTKLTLTGDLLGTLRYMSPEQALAMRVAVDHRTDIYSLGVTLYELLTLEPVFGGEDRQELLRQIAFDEPRPPRQRNPAVPAELATIVLKALAKSPDERYATAQELAEDLQRFLEDRPIRARPPTLVQKLARWGRRHRAVVTTAAVTGVLALLLAVGGVAGSLGWAARGRAARQLVVEQAVARALVEADEWQGQDKWPEALAAVKRADAALVGGEENAALAQQVRQRLSDLEIVRRLEEIRAGLSRLKGEQFDFATADQKYAAAFRDYGIDVENLPVAEAAARIQARAGVVRVLSVELEHWASVRSRRDQARSLSLKAVAEAVDPDPWRRRLRDATMRQDPKGLTELAAEEAALHQPPATQILLAWALKLAGKPENCRTFLRQAQLAYPSDFWINYYLGVELVQGHPSNPSDAIAYLRAAIAVRPGSAAAHQALGAAFRKNGQLAEAVASYREVVRLKEGSWLEAEDFPALCTLGQSLRDAGRLEEAVAVYREAIRIRPEDPTGYQGLGLTWQKQGEFDEAIAAFREVVSLRPKDALPHYHLATVLQERGRHNDAVASYREAVRLNPGALHALAWRLASAPDPQQRNPRWAVELSKQLVEHSPKQAPFWRTLGAAQYRAGDWRVALEALEKATKLDNDGEPLACAFLAMSHWRLGDPAEARRWYERAGTQRPGKPAEEEEVGRARAEAAALLGDKADGGAAPAAPARPETGKPFVLLSGKEQAGRGFGTLAEAVAAAAAGDTVEVRGNGPFVSVPLKITGRALVLRAARGFAPVIQQRAEGSALPLIETDAPLILEGLSLERLGAAAWLSGQPQPRTVLSRGAPLYAANCRFLATGDGGAIAAADSPVCELRNCLLVSTGRTYGLVSWRCPGGGRLLLENCVLAGESGLAIWYESRDLNDVSLRLVHNTVVTSTAVRFYLFRPLPPPGGDAKPIPLEASANVFDAQEAVLRFDQSDGFLGQARGPLSAADAEAVLPRLLRWQERRNFYREASNFLGLSVRYEPLAPTRDRRSLAAWQQFWDLSRTDSLQGAGRYERGDPGAKLSNSPEHLGPADFRLHHDHPGQGAGQGGRDLGAYVDLVGPGPAYDRWQRTPDHADWLKTIGQTR